MGVFWNMPRRITVSVLMSFLLPTVGSSAVPTKAQRRCTDGLDTAAARVARAAAANVGGCVRDAARGRLASTVEQCIAADRKGTVARARAKVVSTAAKRCREVPDFGPTDPGTINTAFADLLEPGAFFGDDLDAAIISASVDKAGAACQRAALDAYAKILAAKLSAYDSCVSTGMAVGLIGSGDDLVRCRDVDPKGTVAKAVERARKRTTKRCAHSDVATAFPGECAGSAVTDLAACWERRATCDLCRARNRSDGIDRVCHAFVDGVARPYCGERPVETHSMARQWDEQLLDAIRRDTPRPTVHARNLWHLSMAMYDAWAAYDDGPAKAYLVDESPATDDAARDRDITIAFAAYHLLRARFPRSPGAATTLAELDAKFLELGFDRDFTSTTGDAPAAVGNRIAAAVLNYGLHDGANEAGDYADDSGYYPTNYPMIVKIPGTQMVDPNLWQPLALDTIISQNGLPLPGKIQVYVSPNWNNVLPFALTRSDPNDVYIDPGPPPRLGGTGDAEYKAMFAQVAEFGSRLDPNDGVMMDISPGALGNNPLGTNDGTGHPLNPATGQPYAPNVVKRGDFLRVLAEFWADGPASETPPGHWNVIANQVADSPLFEKRFVGSGPVLSDLEWDVKTYFALNGAVHDAAVVAWGLKRRYDFVRPISAIRFMGGLGQSSDPAGPSYDPNGIPLVPGAIEVVTSASSMPGERHADLVGSIGQVAILSWPGQPSEPKTTVQGVHWRLAEDWIPYQKSTFVTPAFPGYTSGHSTFSRAAAEVMTRITGNAFVPGGLGEFVARKNEYLAFELGPSEDIRMQWATYYDASDLAGISRLYGGIHPRADDFNGRVTGSQVGIRAFELATKYFAGTAP